jgi:hypothetical protein
MQRFFEWSEQKNIVEYLVHFINQIGIIKLILHPLFVFN